METHRENAGPSADESLARLVAGNERCLRGETRTILPALPEFEPQLPPQVRLAQTVESNVRWTVSRILNSPEGRAHVLEGRMKIVEAIYEIESGRARFQSG